MSRAFHVAGILLALSAVQAGVAAELVSDRVSVRALEGAGGSNVVVRTDASVAGGAVVDGPGVFADGIAWLAPAAGLPMGAFTNTGRVASAPAPTWWRTASVLDEGASAEDYAAATRRQVRVLVRKAAKSFVSAGLGASASWAPLLSAQDPADDEMPVRLGDLKAAAGPFWAGLAAAGATNGVPWAADDGGDDALVNVGQLKQAFAFRLPEPAPPVTVRPGGDPDADSDGDGLTDLEELGGLVVRDGLPWLEFDSAVDLTGSFDGNGLALWTPPAPLWIGDAAVTGVVVDAAGVLYLPRSDAEACWRPSNPLPFDRTRQPEALVLAPFWDGLSLEPGGERPSRVRAGTAVHGEAAYLLFEYADMRCGWPPETISFQVALPVGRTDRAHVRYRGPAGEQVDGRTASVGFQTFHGRVVESHCYRQAGRIRDGLALEMHFGHGTSPARADTDGDGLSDGEEVACETDPTLFDTDGDGMPDGWELMFGFDPGDAADGTLDADGDGLGNAGEYLHGADPFLADTDADGVPDGIEVLQGGDCTDAGDRGRPVPADRFRTLAFDVDGDWAAWELTIRGLGPDDFGVRRYSMPRPGAAQKLDVPLRKGNSYRLSEKWLNSKGHEESELYPWYCWQLRVDGRPQGSTFGIDGRAVWRNPYFKTLYGKGWIAENDDGLMTMHTCANVENGGNVAEGKTATLHILDDPVAVFDYDRDGRISDADIACARRGGTPFRFWVNDDHDSGDVCPPEDYLSDCPAVVGDAADGVVNGRRDLVDFTPVWIDVGRVFPPSLPQRLREGLVWKLSGPGNVVWTSCGRGDAGKFQTQDLHGCGEHLDGPAHEARVARVSGGRRLPEAVVRQVEGPAHGALVLFEGGSRESGMEVSLCDGEGVVLAQGRTDLRLSGVEDMYRWLNLRDVCSNDALIESRLGEPANCPDDTCDGRNFVFVHGFNVNQEEARANGAEMFKRMWQSGMTSMFTVVDWYGDDSQYDSLLSDLVFDGPVCPDYYANVVHAFESAGALAERCAALPGEKLFIAHSLGNMLVSSAVVDHRLAYARYYMLNAAVPMEAYDAKAFASPMVDRAWLNVPKEYRATGWYRLFPSADFRHGLTWKGRFGSLRNAVNLYSATEEVLANAHTWQLTLMGSVWKVQEMSKGTRYWNELNALTAGRTRIACEGGWGVNTSYGLNPFYYLAGFNSTVRKLPVVDVIREPLFTPFRTESTNMHDVALFLGGDAAQAAVLRAKFLADAIPAESFATGANQLTAVAGMENARLDGMLNKSATWPSSRERHGVRQWHHSDAKNVAYFYVHPLFDRMATGK